MPKYLVLPKIGLNMEEGVISEWLVKPGDKVEKEQMVVRAETDKAIQDLFATESGIVYKLLAEPGDVVPCQGKIAILLDEGETYTEEEPKEPEEKQTEEQPKQQEPGKAASVPKRAAAGTGSRARRISPLARKMAKDLGIPEDELRPEQEGKRIVKADVLRYQAQKKEESSAGTFVPFTRKRQVIAKRMLESANQKPRVTLTATVDCEKLIALRTQLKSRQKVSYNEILAKACAVALKKYPEMNCITEPGGYRIMKDIHIGVAVDTPDGLLVPVLRHVDTKGILELAKEFQDLVEKAREGRLTLDEMTGGTFSISNVGMFGIETFDPIINAPECLILGVGCMKECVVPIQHEVGIRTCMKLSLAFDHTVFDGAAAAKLLKEIVTLLEEPVLMLA